MAPTPQQGARLTLSRLKQLLSRHRIRRWTAEQVKEILSAPALVLEQGTVEAVNEHALLLLPHLRVLHRQKKQVADRMQALLDQLQALPADAPVSQQSRDISLLLSFPGIGRILAEDPKGSGKSTIRHV